MTPNDKISFKPPFDSVSESGLKLFNPSDKFVAFKIKTTAPQRYCVRPNAGTVPPGGDAEIKVMLQPGQTDEKHKFMVQSVYVPESYNELETKEEKKDFVSDLWRNPAENPVMSSKLICNFLVPAEESLEDDGDDLEVEGSFPAPIPVATETPVVEEPLYQHNQTVEKPKKVQIYSSNDQTEELRRLRAQVADAMKQIEILSSAPPPPAESGQTPEQQKLFLILLFVAFISGFVLSCIL